MKKTLIIILLLLTFLQNITTVQAENLPSITSEAGILIDYDSGNVLFQKNMHEKLFPASTTKIMTALLTLENCKLTDKIVIDYDLGYVDGNSMFVKKGEEFTVEQVLRVMLIRSANDAALVLAKHISGSTEKFIDLMNERAKKLGATDTHFNNPNGLPDPNHYTSAYDLALIAKQAMKYDKFREIVKTTMVTIPPTLQTPEQRIFRNSNKFLWASKTPMSYKGKIVPVKYDIIDGIKTGYTVVAKQCLVSSAKKNGFRVISVILKCDGYDIYSNSRTLIDYGFDNFSSHQILDKGKILGTKDLKYTKEKVLKYSPEKDYSVVLNNSENKSAITTKVKIKDNLGKNIKKGSVVGYVELYKNKDLVAKVNLIAKDDVHSVFSTLTIFFVIISLFTLIFIISIITKLKRNKVKRRKRYA